MTASQPLPKPALPAHSALDALRAVVADDLRGVDTLIQTALASDVALIHQLGHYIVQSGGKRLRPLLVLLAARACGYDGERHRDLAAVIEFIHTATLLHDDVVDGSLLRRGLDTANARWGDQASVLTGDFLYSRAFQMMVAVGDMEVMAVMADTTNVIAEGEVLQLLNCHDPDTDEARYLEVIRRKTAKLFEAGARIGAILGSMPETVKSALADYGLHLGIAYQLVDDVLDYHGTVEETGKNVGDDLAEGKPTLPLIHALRHVTGGHAETLRAAIRHGGRDTLEPVLAAIESTQALTYTADLARREANAAQRQLAVLPPSTFRDALHELADFAVERSG